jgi:hypothetical protein
MAAEQTDLYIIIVHFKISFNQYAYRPRVKLPSSPAVWSEYSELLESAWAVQTHIPSLGM